MNKTNVFELLGGAPLLPPAPLRPPGTEFIQLPPVSATPFLAPPGTFLQPPGTQSQPATTFNQEENEENHNQYENQRLSVSFLCRVFACFVSTGVFISVTKTVIATIVAPEEITTEIVTVIMIATEIEIATPVDLITETDAMIIGKGWYAIFPMHCCLSSNVFRSETEIMIEIGIAIEFGIEIAIETVTGIATVIAIAVDAEKIAPDTKVQEGRRFSFVKYCK